MISISRSEESKTNELTTVKNNAISKVNERIGEVRVSVITTIPGQDLVYRSKIEEATRYVNSDYSSLDELPFIKLESESTQKDPGLLSTEIIEMAASSALALANIEALRMTYINRIKEAASFSEISTYLSEFESEVTT